MLLFLLAYQIQVPNFHYNNEFFFVMYESLIINIFIDALSISLSPKSNKPNNISSTCPSLEVRKKLFHTTSATSSQSITLKIVTIISLV